MHSALHYRECASRMRSLANSEPNPALREQLETVASDYDEIADAMEQEIKRRDSVKGSAPSPATVAAPRAAPAGCEHGQHTRTSADRPRPSAFLALLAPEAAADTCSARYRVVNLSSRRLAAPRRDIAGNRDPWVVLRGCEGPRLDAKVASDPVAPSRLLCLGTDLPHGRFPHDFHGSVIYP